ncbi:MAG TPA: helix-turn-helix domain-containing protein [Burkholderiales bacterium]
MKSQKQDYTSLLADKWGTEVIGPGYTAVPDVLLANLAQLKITPTELAVLLQLMRFWWTAQQLPFPSKRTVALALGMTEKNVQKVVGRLVKRGLIKRIERRKPGDRSESNCYDFAPLVAKLRVLAQAGLRMRLGVEGKELSPPEPPMAPRAYGQRPDMRRPRDTGGWDDGYTLPEPEQPSGYF